MLTERQIPLEISELRGSHCRVMLGLFRYADKHGCCWPGLRTLGAAIPMSVRALRRALDEMAALGYLVIEKGKGLVNRYRIAARFLRAMGHTVRPVAVLEPAPAGEADERQISFDFGGGTVSPLRTTVSPLRTEGKAKESQDKYKKEAVPFGRDAPLEQPHSGNVVKISQSPELKAKKKEMRRAKVMRFINATYTDDAHRVRLEGMSGCDPVRDEQWWFDKCDAERILADWDDIRDKDAPADGWQRLA